MTLTTTLAEIRRHGLYEDGFAKIRDHFGVSVADAKTHTTPFPVALLLETNDLWGALWVFDRVAPQAMKDDFLIRRLDTGEHSALKSLRRNQVDAAWWRDCEAATVRVVDLLRRRMAGEDVAAQMQVARYAARASSDAAAYAAARAARAASATARAAAEAAAWATAAWAAAAWAAARDAAAAEAAAAWAAARDAARADLLAVIGGDA